MNNGNKAIGVLAVEGDFELHSMMNSWASKIAMLVMALVLVGSSWAQEITVIKYADLCERLKRGDRTVDLGELRSAFSTAADSPAEPDLSGLKDMFKALESKKHREAIKLAESVLEKDYVNIDAHRVLAQAYKETNELERSDFHAYLYRGLIQSILDSGDGKNLNTAYTVISNREEAIILAIKRANVLNQTFQKAGGHSFDVFETAGEGGRKETVYFNVDIPVRNSMRKFKSLPE